MGVVVNAIFSLNNSGIHYRNLDSKYPPWQTVFYRTGDPALYPA